MNIDERYQACLEKLSPEQIADDRLTWKLSLMRKFYQGIGGDLDTSNEHEFIRWHRARLFAAEDKVAN